MFVNTAFKLVFEAAISGSKQTPISISVFSVSSLALKCRGISFWDVVVICRLLVHVGDSKLH